MYLHRKVKKIVIISITEYFNTRVIHILFSYKKRVNKKVKSFDICMIVSEKLYLQIILQ